MPSVSLWDFCYLLMSTSLPPAVLVCYSHVTKYHRLSGLEHIHLPAHPSVGCFHVAWWALYMGSPQAPNQSAAREESLLVLLEELGFLQCRSAASVFLLAIGRGGALPQAVLALGPFCGPHSFSTLAWRTFLCLVPIMLFLSDLVFWSWMEKGLRFERLWLILFLSDNLLFQR